MHLGLCVRVQRMMQQDTASKRIALIGWQGYGDAARHVIRPAACVSPAPQPSRTEDRTPLCPHPQLTMREIVHIQAGQCGNQIGAKVGL